MYAYVIIYKKLNGSKLPSGFMTITQRVRMVKKFHGEEFR
jgi:hypothetical protein